MGIPGFPFSRDFRHPVVIIGTPLDCKQRERYEDAYSTDGTISCQNMSGAEWPSIKW